MIATALFLRSGLRRCSPACHVADKDNAQRTRFKWQRCDRAVDQSGGSRRRGQWSRLKRALNSFSGRKRMVWAGCLLSGTDTNAVATSRANAAPRAYSSSELREETNLLKLCGSPAMGMTLSRSILEKPRGQKR